MRIFVCSLMLIEWSQIKCDVHCGVPEPVQNPLIVKGQNTLPGQWPWHAAIYHREATSEDYKCGGTLISNWFVLTAAHCVTTENGNVLAKELVFIKLGVHDLKKLRKSSTQQHDVIGIFKEPRFSAETLTHDIALLKLGSEAEYDSYVQPACLYGGDSLEGQFGTVIGYGLTEHNVLAMVLRKAVIPVINFLKCLESDRDFFGHVLADEVLCAGHTNGTTACNGDSGGGLFFKQNGTWHLGGIVSRSRVRDDGTNFCYTGGYTIYTKVSKYLHWIRSTMRKNTGRDATTLPSDESIDDVNTSAIPHGRVVVCYISSWAVYRSGAGSFSLKNFDPNLCTHVVHAYAGLDVERNTIKSLDRWQDLKDNYGLGGYEKLVNLRNSYPHLKVMISMGGWNEGSMKYSKLAASQQRRQVFAENALNFIRRYGFDGLDLDWEYPTQRGGEPNDRENFVQLVRELSQKFKKNNLLLTSTIEAKQYVIDAAYDIENLTKYLDLLHVKCYDYRGIWNQKIGFNAPLAGDEVHNVEFTIEHLLALGAPPNKLVLGLPFHGRTFIADSIFYTRIGDPAETSFSGPYTNIDGYIGYNEICTELNAKSSFWNQAWDPEASEVIARMQDGSKTKVIVYDSTRSIAAKVRYAVQKNLRGLMASSIDTDDFHGNCNAEEETFVDFDNKLRTPPPIQGKFKLLRTINNAIVAAEDEIHNS